MFCYDLVVILLAAIVGGQMLFVSGRIEEAHIVINVMFLAIKGMLLLGSFSFLFVMYEKRKEKLKEAKEKARPRKNWYRRFEREEKKI